MQGKKPEYAKGGSSSSGPAHSEHAGQYGMNVPNASGNRENINDWLQNIQKRIKRPGLKQPQEGLGDQKDAQLTDLINQLFLENDAFNKGFLDLDDFRGLLVKNTGKKFSDKEVKDLLKVADRNFDKVIDKQELRQFYLMLIEECKILRP